MATPKSPFYVTRQFLSPKICEEIVTSLNYHDPDVNKDGNPIKMSRHHQANEDVIFDKFEPVLPKLEQYYNFKHRGTEAMSFDFYAEGVKSDPICESCNYLRKKWVRTKDRDFTAILFLSDYQDKEDFDGEYEVYGGKVEFPQHNFGFNPERGTMIVYPSGPHFINVVSPILLGDLLTVKWHVAASSPYLYDPTKFPGDYKTWFKGLF